MKQETPVNWVAYHVVKIGCGEPDETIGYYSNRNKAELAALAASCDGKNMCKHEKFEIKQITIQT